MRRGELALDPAEARAEPALRAVTGDGAPVPATDHETESGVLSIRREVSDAQTLGAKQASGLEDTLELARAPEPLDGAQPLVLAARR